MKKNSILIGIIVVMFLAAGIILYKGFFAAPGGSQSADSASVASTMSSEKILPHGTSLDFGLIKKFNGGTKFFNYPVVTPGEVNVQIQNLVK